jgi:hypothetical protein
MERQILALCGPRWNAIPERGGKNSASRLAERQTNIVLGEADPPERFSRGAARDDSRDHVRCRYATTSISAVWGNISKGVIEVTSKHFCNSARSRPSVGGLHDT